MPILPKPLLSSAAELSPLCTTENKQVLSANNLVLDHNSPVESFIMSRNSGPSIKHCETPASTL